jgi:dienelactone hydrolase
MYALFRQRVNSFPELACSGDSFSSWLVLRPPAPDFRRTPSAGRSVISRSAESDEHLAIAAHLLLVHARALTEAGIAVLLVDPFGGRGVRDTISAQDQFSFAASTCDVFAAMRALEGEGAIDAARLGAMGCSRGGVSVLQAAITPLVQAALGSGKALRAVLAGWPWCGYQFADPKTAPTVLRLVVADFDDWVSPLQCQGYAAAMKRATRTFRCA